MGHTMDTKSVSNCSTMKTCLVSIVLLFCLGMGHTKSVNPESVVDRSEIEATADRNLAIMEAMLNRAALGDTETMPAILPKVTGMLTKYLAWFIDQILIADPFATPGSRTLNLKLSI